ncbi:MAG: alpha/beta fold hydrolase [Nocardioidaceae bacterium]
MADQPDIARSIELPGPWQHRYVAANGARFHVTEAGTGPLVLLLHGFPEFWWSWRDQIPALADAGFRVAAMDLRGYGGSDKTPRGYDPFTLAQDVSGVVQALGESQARVIGHGWGGYLAWATAVLHPREVAAVAALSAPHPSVMLRALRRGRRVGALGHVLAMQLPMLPERRLADAESGYLHHHLRSWSGSAYFPTDEVVSTYQAAIGLWPASHCALEYHRWLFRSRLRADGRRFNASMRTPVTQPTLCLTGANDPAVPPALVEASGGRVSGPFTAHVLDGVGHFVHEEAPTRVNALLLDWLG